MKSSWIVGIVSIFLVVLSSCENNMAGAGSSILSDKDDIQVKSDTFGVVSALDSCAAITLTPDSFLLGECDTHFGTIKADILTQLACPEGFKYPDSLELTSGKMPTQLQVDSVCLYLYYKNWYGDGNSPLGITVHEMDRQTLLDYEKYGSDMNVEDYCSLDENSLITTESVIVVPTACPDSSYSNELEEDIPTIRIKLSDDFAQRFFKIKEFPSQTEFNDLFKGLYISTDFGGSNVLYIRDINMTVFYHFDVQDTTMYDTKSFYVNEEVRQVNRYIYPNRTDIMHHYAQIVDTNYIVSPANIYTKLSIRIDSIKERINTQLGSDKDSYRVYVNKASLKVDVLYSDSLTDRPRDNWSSPASYMMLIKANRLESFFAKNELPSDSVAIIASLSATTDSLGCTMYGYTYDLSSLLTQQIRSQEEIETLDFTLVPVSIESNTNGNIIAVRQLQTISATCIRSANNMIDPMDIEMVYAGFNR